MPSVTPVNTNRVQTCPHGLPPGGCPICSGMGGGGAKVKKPDPPKQTMSIAEMYAIWNRMKAQDARKEQLKADNIKQAEALQKTKEALNSMMNKLSVVLTKIQNILPEPVAKLLNIVSENVLKPLVNIIQKFPEAVKSFNQFIQNIKTEAFIAAEKLASVFGEIKNFIQKSVSNSFKKFTKKVYKILNIFGLESNEDYEEDERVNTEIYAFKARDVKNIKEILLEIITKRKEGNND